MTSRDAASRAGEPAAERSAGEAVPRHVAIIMDGNGRWAEARGLPRIEGHRAGAEAVRRTLRAAIEVGVEVLTLYAFSSENWRRPKSEVADLAGLMLHYVERELDELDREGVRIRLIGDPAAFGEKLAERLDAAVERTAANRRLTLVIALNYGSRAEIVAAARSLAASAVSGKLDPAAIDETMLAERLQTSDLPPLDLVVRTSGELRLSNFLLWQAAYAELMFVETLWPDFASSHFAEVIARFGRRRRRFGGR